MYEIDKTDINIINLLMEDGRMPASKMARRIGGISERVIRYRIERIIKEGYIQISAITNPKSLGYLVTADVFLEVESGAILEVAKKQQNMIVLVTLLVQLVNQILAFKLLVMIQVKYINLL